MSRGLLSNKKSPIFNHSDLKKTNVYSSYKIFICIFIFFPFGASSNFFSFKFLKNIHLEYILIFCLITRNYVSKSFGKKCVLVAQSCPTLCDPMDCSPPGFSVHGIFQARILEWIAISFSKGTSQPRDQTLVFCIGGRFFII